MEEAKHQNVKEKEIEVGQKRGQQPLGKMKMH